MNATVIVQARTMSNRLPRKALLPVGEYPCVLLACLRAANAGIRLILATSDHPSDDVLAEMVCSRGIATVRGPLNDVLARYALAAANLADDSVLVRMTADNVLPDGELVRELLSAFAEQGTEYLSLDSPQSGVPYGLSAEVFSVRTLRKAHASANSAFDREHVTPCIRRNCTQTAYKPHLLSDADYSHLRCTIDDEEDYRRICRLFEGIQNPLRASWFDLTKKLAGLPGEPAFRVPYRISSDVIQSEFTLGTAQCGMSYGVTNLARKPSRKAAVTMIRHSIAHGVTAVDTAREYGEAESILADALAGAWRSRVGVSTKLSSLGSLSAHADPRKVEMAVEQSVRQSCAALGVQNLQTLLLHRFRHYDAWGGAIWKTLLKMRAENRIERIGASIYEPEEALRLLADPECRHLQIPFNVLDWRWKAAGIPEALRNRRDVTVHARSALLQGLLTAPPQRWQALAGCSNCDADACFHQLSTLARKFRRESIVDLCFAYVRSQTWIHSVVVGCDHLEQLTGNLRLFCLPHLSDEQCEELESSMPKIPAMTLNPSLWNAFQEQVANG